MVRTPLAPASLVSPLFCWVTLRDVLRGAASIFESGLWAAECSGVAITPMPGLGSAIGGGWVGAESKSSIFRFQCFAEVGWTPVLVMSWLTMSKQVGKRCRACFARVRTNTGNMSAGSTPVGGGYFKCSSITRSPRGPAANPGVSPTKGRRPVSSSHSRIPREYWSAAGVSSPPVICSGDIYASVPMRLAAVVTLPATRATPKSLSRIAPWSARRTLLGFRSRWMTPLLWAKSNAVASERAIRIASEVGSSFFVKRCCCSVGPVM